MANLLQIMCSIEYNNIFAIFSLKMLPRTDLWMTLRYFMIIMVLLLTSTALMETRIFNVSIKMSFLGFLIVFCGYCHYLPESYRKQLTYHRTRFISLIHCFCPFPRVTSVLKKSKHFSFKKPSSDKNISNHSLKICIFQNEPTRQPTRWQNENFFFWSVKVFPLSLTDREVWKLPLFWL